MRIIHDPHGCDVRPPRFRNICCLERETQRVRETIAATNSTRRIPQGNRLLLRELSCLEYDIDTDTTIDFRLHLCQ